MTFMKDPVLRIGADVVFAVINALVFSSFFITSGFSWDIAFTAGLAFVYFMTDALYVAFVKES